VWGNPVAFVVGTFPIGPWLRQAWSNGLILQPQKPATSTTWRSDVFLSRIPSSRWLHTLVGGGSGNPQRLAFPHLAWRLFALILVIPFIAGLGGRCAGVRSCALRRRSPPPPFVIGGLRPLGIPASSPSPRFESSLSGRHRTRAWASQLRQNPVLCRPTPRRSTAHPCSSLERPNAGGMPAPSVTPLAPPTVLLISTSAITAPPLSRTPSFFVPLSRGEKSASRCTAFGGFFPTSYRGRSAAWCDPTSESGANDLPRRAVSRASLASAFETNRRSPSPLGQSVVIRRPSVGAGGVSGARSGSPGFQTNLDVGHCLLRRYSPSVAGVAPVVGSRPASPPGRTLAASLRLPNENALGGARGCRTEIGISRRRNWVVKNRDRRSQRAPLVGQRDRFPHVPSDFLSPATNRGEQRSRELV